MKEDRGGLQPQEKMEIILIVLIGGFLIYILKHECHMDNGTVQVIIEFYNYWLCCYLYKFNRWIDKYVLKKNKVHFCYTLILYLAILSQTYLPNERQSVWLDALRILYFAFPRKILATMNVFSQYVRQWACTLGRFPPWSHLESYSQAVCPQWVLPTSILIYLLYLYRYCAICLLLYCMLTALGYYFLYIYILFLFLTSTSFFSTCRNYADRYTLLSYRQKTAFDLWYIPYLQTD